MSSANSNPPNTTSPETPKAGVDNSAKLSVQDFVKALVQKMEQADNANGLDNAPLSNQDKGLADDVPAKTNVSAHHQADNLSTDNLLTDSSLADNLKTDNSLTNNLKTENSQTDNQPPQPHAIQNSTAKSPKTKPKVVAVTREAGEITKTLDAPKSSKKTKKTKQPPSQNAQPDPFPFWGLMLVAVLAGLSFVFSLAPYGLWLVAILSPMILYALLLMTARPSRAFLVGLAYGFGVWASGAFWLYTSISLYGGVPSWLALILIGIMALGMGLFHAGMAWAFVKFLGKQPLAFAAVWVVQEWLKTWLFTGFPWLFVGYAFTEVAILSPLAPIFGVLGISFVAVLFSASLVELLRQKAGYLLIAIAMFVGSLLLWLINPTWTTPTGKTLSVSLIQGNIPQDVKWLTEYQQQTLEIYAELSQNEWTQDLVVWPEGAITVFQDEAQLVLDDIDRFARRHNTAFLTGIPYRDMEKFDPEKDPYPPFYNSVMALGAGTGIYQKQNLVPFGEYIPMGLDLFPQLANNHNIANHSKGKKIQAPLNIKDLAMGVAICYEVAYPETTRRNAKDSDFLLTVSNDAWFGTSSGPHQHLQMVQMRALETGRWFARGTNTGVTAIINEKGQIVAKAPQFVRTVLRGDVAMMTGRTPYMVWGVYPMLLICAVLIGLSAFAGGARGRYFAKDGKYMQDYR